ncbi:hypothetical protein CWE09_09235 [Aliidiomarina minuta]|uniref:Uncharacterized protein n=1 Tax=Aliidiomarina minuta TaxID=880057 RepID=A0A432W9M4_9GAMM|nr:EAL domain-containing protein [Aliidiomarina minuta]RUO26853.1 hypothetical protein CWE09_09235 [Aliidiomarina minuta]
MALMVDKSTKDREPILRAFGRVFIAIFLLAALAIGAFTWERSLNQQEQELQHVSRLMAQGLRSHFSTFEVILRGLADELVYRDVFNDSAAGDAYLERVQSSHVGIVGYGLVGLDGEFIATSTRNLLAPLPNIIHHGQTGESFSRVIEDERFHIGRPYYFEAVGEWIIPLRVPVYDQNNELAGVLTAGNRLDGGDASWARMSLPEGVQAVFLRDDGYVNYIHPVDDDPELLQAIFSSQVTEAMQELMLQGRGFFFHQRETAIGDYRRDYIWMEPVENYDLRVVSMAPRSKLIADWINSLILPMTLWLLSAFLTLLGYLRARRLLRKADVEIREKQAQLMLSVQQYDQLTRLIPIGVYQFRLTPEGKHQLTYTSQRFREIFRLSKDFDGVTIAQHVYEQLHPQDKEAFFTAQAHATKYTDKFYWEGRILADGEVYWANVHSVPSQESDSSGRLWNGVVIDVTEQKLAEEKINQLAYYDALTRLPNRRLLRERLEKAVLRSVEGEEYAALLFIDVDRFKQLNDSYGHAQGDLMLQEIGSRLHKLVRDRDTVSRLGGDEFVVLLSRLTNDADKAAAEVEVVLQKIERLLSEPFNFGQQTARITLSTGITLIDGRERDIDAILQQADQAMYRAKESGRNTQCFYDANIQRLITDQLELQRDLRLAIAEDQLQLYYQLQVDRYKQVAGVEALVRWHHPQRGMVMPGVFIHVAEQSDDIICLGDWILDRACRQLLEWQNHPQRFQWSIAVNVSVRQLRADDFADKVIETLQRTGARPDRLLLEITESMLLIDTEQVIQKMARLKKVGVRFSLDDFGTGYSSLGYLNRLPIDELKIDQSFVSDMTDDEHHQVLIRTILSLGKTLSLTTIAEGVETEQQFTILKALGCDRFQGYWFGRPVPAHELPEY